MTVIEAKDYKGNELMYKTLSKNYTRIGGKYYVAIPREMLTFDSAYQRLEELGLRSKAKINHMSAN